MRKLRNSFVAQQHTSRAAAFLITITAPIVVGHDVERERRRIFFGLQFGRSRR
jgi:hypothetical protein